MSARLLLFAALAGAPAHAQDSHAQDGEPYAPAIEEPTGEGAAAIESMQPADGFTVELWAEEPMLANPVCLYVTGEGDCYVGETFRHHAGVTDLRDHMDWLEQDLAARTVQDRVLMLMSRDDDFEAYSVEHDRVRLIRDTDGDGRADEAVVFADGFNDPAAGIGAGLLEHEGDVYYTCIPDLWALRDTDGDGTADVRRALSSGYGVHIAMLGHDLHGLRIGPDGRLYFSCGDRGFTVQTPDGTLDHHWAGGVLRCELDGSNLEVFHSGLRNPQELAFNELGDLFTGDNNSDSIDRARFVHVTEGGDSGWRYSYQWMEGERARGPWNEEKLWYPHFPGQAAYLNPPIEWLGNGPSGLTYDPGTGLPPEYARHFFLVDFRGGRSFSGIHAFDLEPRGAGYALGEVEPFLWGALAVDCDFGPDGALWFCDWVEGWSKTGRGRVYRMFAPEAAATEAAKSTRGLLARGVADATTEELGERLAHPDQRVRLAAQLALASHGTDGLATLQRAAESGATLLARLHGIWGVGYATRRFGGSAEGLIPLLRDEDQEVRAQVVRTLGDVGIAANGRILELLADEAPRVRYFAALAAGKLQLPAATPALINQLVVAGERDPALRHAATFGLAGCRSSLEELAAHDNVDVRAGAVVALRRRIQDSGDNGEARTLARFLGDEHPRVGLEAARALYDLGRFEDLWHMTPSWSDELDSPASREEPGRGFRVPFLRRVLGANVALGKSHQAERLAFLALDGSLDLTLRVDALQLLADWERPAVLDYVDGRYRDLGQHDASSVPGLVTLLRDEGILEAEAPLVRAWIELGRRVGATDHAGDWISFVRDPGRVSEVRTAALEALAEHGHDELAGLVEQCLSDPDASVRATALDVLEQLDGQEALALLPHVRAHGTRAEQRTAYRILGRAADPDAVEMLAEDLAKLRSGSFPAELALDLVRAAEARSVPAIDEHLGALHEARTNDPLVAPYMDALFGGDAERGRAVFERTDLSCQRCHALEEGGERRVGPHHTGLGERSTRLQLVASIVDPNRTVTPGFAGSVLFLFDGDIVAGRIVEEDETTLTVMNADGEQTVVVREDVEEQRPDLSAMPEGLAKSITPEDMRDLLEYLASL